MKAAIRSGTAVRVNVPDGDARRYPAFTRGFQGRRGKAGSLIGVFQYVEFEHVKGTVLIDQHWLSRDER